MKPRLAKVLTLLYLYIPPFIPALYVGIVFYNNPLAAFLSAIVVYFTLQYFMAYTLRNYMERKQLEEDIE